MSTEDLARAVQNHRAADYEDERWRVCPHCGSANVYQAEEDDLSSENCGGLYNFCEDCGESDLPEGDG